MRDPDPASPAVRAQTVTSKKKTHTKKKTRGVFIFHLRLQEGGKKSSPIDDTAQRRVCTNGVKTLKKKLLSMKRLIGGQSPLRDSSSSTGETTLLRAPVLLSLPSSAVTSAKAVLGNGTTYLALL